MKRLNFDKEKQDNAHALCTKLRLIKQDLTNCRHDILDMSKAPGWKKLSRSTLDIGQIINLIETKYGVDTRDENIKEVFVG